MSQFSTLLGKQKLLPIIQASTAEQGVAIARAMHQAGVNLVEVVLRTPASLEALIAIKQALPQMIVGAGTVTNSETLQQALAANADFIVTPAISNELLKQLANVDVPVLPGVSSPSDILLASEYGYKELKLFPAALSGGQAFIGAMSSLFPQIKFCPTGGVNQENQSEYLALTNVFAVGGTWVSPAKSIEQGDWQHITQVCELALAG